MRKQVAAVLAAMLLGATFIGWYQATAATQWGRFGVGWTRDESFAYVSLAGGVRSPKALMVEVSASPDQKVDLDWYVSCNTDDFEHYGSKSGTTSLMAPYTKTIPLPISAPDECDLQASVSGDGKVKVVLLKK